MRRKMQELAAGIYEYEGPKIKILPERIELVAYPNESLKGSFVIESLNRVNMRGIVFSNHPRMKLKTQEISGTKAVIEYEFYTESLSEGDIQQGQFFIILNKNEYSLSFVVSTKAPIIHFKDKSLVDLDDFLNLAKDDYERANQVFGSGEFFKLLRKEPAKVTLAARLLAYENAPASNMEEFLVSCGKKEGIELSTDYVAPSFEGVSEDIREQIEFNKNTWGYCELSCATDCSFIEFQNTTYTSDDFIGNTLLIPYYIRYNQLHGGYNYGRIYVKKNLQQFAFDIVVHQGKKVVEEANKNINGSLHADIQKSKYELYRMYVDYRIGKLMPASFSLESLQLIDHMIGILKEDAATQKLWLLKAFVLIQSNRMQEATWVLDQVKKNLSAENLQTHALYLYITTFLNKERTYLRKVVSTVKKYYMEHEAKEVYFWILLFLDEAYENSASRRVRAIFNHLGSKGISSPMYYVEIWYLLRNDPSLLEELSDVAVRFLQWVYKEELMTEELAHQIFELVKSNRVHNKALKPLLMDCYEKWPTLEHLDGFCQYLCRINSYSKEDFPIYCKAIESELHSQGLYEALIYSAYGNSIGDFPKAVQYYFQYPNNLSYKYKAKFFAMIIKNREKQTTLYLNCKPEIERFVIEQLYAGHLDENLGYIYSFYLRQISMTHELSRALAPLLYIHKFELNDKNIVRAFVTHKQLNKIAEYPVLDGDVYFPIYSKDYEIAFEDDQGRRYIKSVEYDRRVLISSEGMTKKCIKVAPEQMPYLIHYFDVLIGNQVQIEFQDFELSYLNILLSSDYIKEDYKKTLRPLIIDYYYRSARIELLDEYLKNLDFEGLKDSVRLKATELLIKRGFFEKAYAQIVSYGCHQVSKVGLLTLCSSMITEREYKPDDYLIGLCGICFSRGEYDGVLLKYLIKYMFGSTHTLYEVWIAAKDFALDIYELEERLLVQMLYTGCYIDRSEEILTDYITNGGKKLVLDAYVSYFSYQYFVKGSPANALVMEQLQGMYEKEQKISVCEKLSLLKYLSQNNSEEVSMMKKLYEELVLAGYHFAFFDKLPAKVKSKYPRMGKRVVEFCTNPKNTVYIHYLHTNYSTDLHGKEEYITEQMEPMLEGIFVKEFTLFYGDEVMYYITEGASKDYNIAYSSQVAATDIDLSGEKNRYNQLNAMVITSLMGENENYQKRRELYDSLRKRAKIECKPLL